MSDERRVRRAGIVAALGHVLAIYLFASLPPRAAVREVAVATTADAGMTPVEMVLDPGSVAASRAEQIATGTATTDGPPVVTEPDPNDGFSPMGEDGADLAGLPRLLLAQAVDIAPEVGPAPTGLLRARRVTPEDTNESVRALVRDQDRALGLGAPQQTIIAAAVQEAGRPSGVPSGILPTPMELINDGGGREEVVRREMAPLPAR